MRGRLRPPRSRKPQPLQPVAPRFVLLPQLAAALAGREVVLAAVRLVEVQRRADAAPQRHLRQRHPRVAHQVIGHPHLVRQAEILSSHHRELEVGQVFDVEPRHEGNSKLVAFHISHGCVAKHRQKTLPPSSTRFFCVGAS